MASGVTERDLSQSLQGGRGAGQDQMDGSPASGRHTAGSPGRRTLQSAPNRSQHPLSAISLLLSSQRAGTVQAAATCSGILRRCLWHPGGKAGQWKEGRGSHPHPQTSQRLAARRWLHSRREPTPPDRLPAPPRHRPHPQSFRRPSAHPPRRGSGRVPRGQLEQQAWEQRSSHLLAPEGSVASLLPSAKQAPGPAPRARGSCGREPGAAEALSAQPRGEAPSRCRSRGSSLPAKSCSLPPSLGRFVRPSVRGALPPPPPPPPPPPRPLQPQLGSASPHRLAAPLTGSQAPSLAPCPRRCRRRAERSPAGHGLPLPRSLSGGGGGGATQAGRRGESGGGGEAAPSVPYRSPPGRAAPGPAGERRAARQRRERGGGPGASPREGAQGEGVRGGVTPRARCWESQDLGLPLRRWGRWWWCTDARELCPSQEVRGLTC
ncbi:uncharacterized protein LOC120890528 isoform X2 [Ictidomys tridecemlineatus]